MAASDAVYSTAVARRELRTSLTRLEGALRRGDQRLILRERNFLDALHRQSVRASGLATGRAYTTTPLTRFGDKAVAALSTGNSATIGRMKSSLLADFSVDSLAPARDWTMGVDEWVWTTNGSACPSCLGRHGHVYRGAFVPTHPSCLCIASPVGTPGLRTLSDSEIQDTISRYGLPRYQSAVRDWKAGVKTRQQVLGMENVNSTRAGAQAVRNHAAKAEVRQTALPPSSVTRPRPGQVLDTDEFYKLPNGSYTAERARLHDEIIEAFLRDLPKPDTPTLIMTGGGPASGKSTMVKSRPDLFPSSRAAAHVDADAVKKFLPEYRGLVRAKDARAAAFVHEESSYLSKRILSEAYRRQHSVLYDSVGDSGIAKLSLKIDEAKAAGQRVVANYASLDTDLAVEIAKKRAAATGREVPYSYLRAAHADVTDTFIDGIRLKKFDEANLFDTNVQGVARPVLRYDGGNVEIIDRQLFADFVAKGTRPLDEVMRLLGVR